MHLHRSILAALLGAVLAGCAPDAPPTPPVGEQLLSGAYTLRGMTSDGWLVYSDNQTLTLHAIAISGGAAKDIVSLGIDFAISVWGKTVFAWSNKNSAAVGALTVWTSDGGARAVSSSSLAPWVAATMDGSRVLYLDNVDKDGQKGDLVAAGGDGSSPRVMLTGLTGLNSDACRALLGFAGSYALAAHCGAGATHATITSFDSAGRPADLATGAAVAWSTDPAGTTLLTANGSGTIAVPLGGGSPKVIDPSGGTGVFVDNGQTALYGTSSHALRRSPVSSPSPMTLVETGVTGLYGVSPDGRYALYYGTMDRQTLISDLYLTSTSMPGATTTLSATQSAGVFGDAFTADGSHVLYSTDVDTSWQTMTLNALAPGDSSPTVLAHSAWVVWAATGAKVVLNDHYTWTGLRGHADLRVADTSTGATTLIVNQADTEFFLSPSRDRVIYTWSLEDGPRQGVYVADIP